MVSTLTRIGISSKIGRAISGCQSHAAKHDTQFQPTFMRAPDMTSKKTVESELIAMMIKAFHKFIFVQKATTRAVVESGLSECSSASAHS